MSAFLSLLMIGLAVEGMVSHSDWRYWMSALALSAFFALCHHIGRFVSIFEGKNGQEDLEDGE